MTDERARDMETDYNMRGFFHIFLVSETHHSGRLVLAINTYFPSCNLFSDFTLLHARVFLFLLCSFSIYHPPFFEILFF
jgi:hypothetical protein